MKTKHLLVTVFLFLNIHLFAQQRIHYQYLRGEDLSPANSYYVPYVQLEKESATKRMGLMDSRTKKFVLNPVYDHMVQYNDFLIVSINSESGIGVIDYSGKEILPMIFSEIYVSKNVIQCTGKVEEYDYNSGSSEGMDSDKYLTQEQIAWEEAAASQAATAEATAAAAEAAAQAVIADAEAAKEYEKNEQAIQDTSYNKPNNYGLEETYFTTADTNHYYSRHTYKLLFKLNHRSLGLDQAPRFVNNDTLAHVRVTDLKSDKISEQDRVFTMSGKTKNFNRYFNSSVNNGKQDVFDEKDSLVWSILDNKIIYSTGDFDKHFQMTFNGKNIPIEGINKLNQEATKIWTNLYLVGLQRRTYVLCNDKLEITHENNLKLDKLKSEMDYSHELTRVFPFESLEQLENEAPPQVFNEGFLLVQKMNLNLNSNVNRADEKEMQKYNMMNIVHYGYIDTTGKFIISPQFPMAYPFNEGLAAVIDTISFKVSFINPKKETIIKTDLSFNNLPPAASYSHSAMSEGMVFYDGLCHYKNSSNQYAYLNRTGNTVITLPPFISFAGNFSDGIAPVIKSDLVDYSQTEKLGFINKKGEIIVPFKYAVPLDFDRAQRFKNKLFLLSLTYQEYGFIGSDGFEYFEVK